MHLGPQIRYRKHLGNLPKINLLLSYKTMICHIKPRTWCSGIPRSSRWRINLTWEDLWRQRSEYGITMSFFG